MCLHFAGPADKWEQTWLLRRRNSLKRINWSIEASKSVLTAWTHKWPWYQGFFPFTFILIKVMLVRHFQKVNPTQKQTNPCVSVPWQNLCTGCCAPCCQIVSQIQVWTLNWAWNLCCHYCCVPIHPVELRELMKEIMVFVFGFPFFLLFAHALCVYIY